MNKRISLKLFLTVVWRGVSQVFQSVLKLFGYKEGTSFGKVIWRIFAVCFTILFSIVTILVTYAFIEEVVYREWIRPYTREVVYSEKHLSNHVVLQELYHHDHGRVYDESKKKVVIKDVDWVVVSEDKDSLAVFAKGDKRGYLNRFTGEVVLPAIYSRAWCFSEGLAAVEKDNKLVFIDHRGNVLIDKDFEVHFSEPEYVFHGGYCRMENKTDGKLGLIDQEGNWALNPTYDDVVRINKHWKVVQNDLQGLFSENLDTLFTVDNSSIYVGDHVIEVRFSDHTAKRFDMEGNILVDFVIDHVENMHYATTELKSVENEEDSSDSNVVYGVSKCQKYMVKGRYYDEYFGLLDRDGKRITDPEFTSIDAIAEDLYLCQPHGIILNGKGVRVK